MSRAREREDLRSHFWRRKVRPLVLQRDNWMCHLCGLPIESYLDEQGERHGRYKSPHPLSASVDHIVGHETGMDMRYLKAAHRGCNMKQGDPARLRSHDPVPVGRTRW